MNKKGSYELASLAGFILIFLAVIIFGYIFVALTPESNLKLIENEKSNYLVKYDLFNYLNYEVDGETIADLIVDEKFDLVESRTEELLGKNKVNYWITISREDKKVLKEIIIYGPTGRYKPSKLKYNSLIILDNDMYVYFTRWYQSPTKLVRQP
jgi:hypothetical protein